MTLTFCSYSSTHQAATSTSAFALAGLAGRSVPPSTGRAARFNQHRLERSLLPRRPTVSTRDWVKPAGSMLMLMAGRIVTSELSAFLALKMQMWSNCHCMSLKRVGQLQQSFTIVDTTNILGKQLLSVRIQWNQNQDVIFFAKTSTLLTFLPLIKTGGAENISNLKVCNC